MNKLSAACVTGLLALGLMTSRAQARVYVHLTGEDGMVDYDMAHSSGRGWYTEPDSPGQKYSLGFKQGERGSTNPVQVATLKRTEAEHFMGKSALEMQIISRKENKPGSTAAYKISLDVSPGGLVMVGQPKDWYLGFAMKIDPVNYSLPEGPDGKLLFQQWWQGSPFHPPVSLQIVNQATAAKFGWKDANPNGNFALMLTDVDHNPGGPNDKGQPQVYNIGPVQLGEWLRWVICVRPDPSGKDGAVIVWLNEEKKVDLHPMVVGFNQDPAKGMKTGSKDFWVNMDIYRLSGLNSQRLFFDEIKLADSLVEAVPPAATANPSLSSLPSPLSTAVASPTPEKAVAGTLMKACPKELLVDGKKIGFVTIPVGTKVTVVSELPDGFLVIREQGEEPYKIAKDSLCLSRP